MKKKAKKRLPGSKVKKQRKFTRKNSVSKFSTASVRR